MIIEHQLPNVDYIRILVSIFRSHQGAGPYCRLASMVVPRLRSGFQRGKAGQGSQLTHSRVLLGAIRDDFDVVSIHIIAEEVIEVRL